MRMNHVAYFFSGALALGALACSEKPKAPNMADTIHDSLQRAGLRDVSVKDDRDKAEITLGGKVQSYGEKMQAESIAKASAGGQVVADEIAVLPPGDVSAEKKINSDLDKGIKDNLDAALVRSGLQKQVKYDVKNGVVRLTGDVDTEARRSSAERLTAGIPNVQQVVNELQIKNQPATSTR